MALNAQDRAVVLRYLEPKYRKAYEEGALDDDDLRAWAETAGVLRPRADFSGVSGSVSSTAQAPDTRSPITRGVEEVGNRLRSLGGIASEAGVGGLQRSAGAAGITMADSMNEPSSARRASLDALLSPLASVTDAVLRLRDGTGLREQAEQGFRTGEAGVEAATERARREAPLGETLSVGIADVASSPSSALSVLGGPAAVIVGADVYAQEYARARMDGLSERDAAGRAALMAGNETALSVVPTGRWLGKVPGLDRVIGREAAERLSGDVSKTVTRVARTAGGEAAQETAVTFGQLAIDRTLASEAPTEELRRYSESQLPKDITELWEVTKRSAVAGALGGGALSTPVEVMRTVQERGRMAGELLQSTEMSRRDRRPDPSVEPTQPTLFPDAEPSGESFEDLEAARQKQYEEEAAWSLRQRERDTTETRQARQEELRTSIVNRVDSARDRVYTLQDQIEAGDTSQATLAEATRAQRDLTVAEQRLSSFDDSMAPQVAEAPEAVAPAVEPVQGTLELPAPAEAVAPAAAPTKRRGRSRKAKAPLVSVQPEAAPENSTRAQMEAFIANGLAQRQQDTTDVTVQRVVDSMVKRLGKGDTKKAAKLIIDGNLRLVNSESEIPGNAVPAGTAGWYDGQRTYVVADKLNPSNIVGDLLNVAAHEVKHAADMSSPAGLRATIGEFIGKDANDKLVDKIERLAGTGNTVAQRAVTLAKAGSSPETYALELPAYFINAARDKRKQGGRVASVLGDTVSAVRVAAKRMGKVDDVNLNDVAYLSDKLLAEAAISGENLASRDPIGEGLQMIVGPQHPMFEQLKAEGKTYISVDGNEKAVVSDADSRVVLQPSAVEALVRRSTALLSEVIDHPTLFAAYPDLANVRVSIDPTLGSGEAYFDPETGGISLSEAHITEVALTGDTNRLRRDMLHEIQHAVQEREGFARGGNWRDMLTPAQARTQAKYDATMSMIDNTVSGVLSDPMNNAGLDEATAEELASFSVGQIGSDFTVDEVIQTLEADGGRYATSTAKGLRTLMDRAATLKLETEQNEIEATDRYYKLLGEKEAYFTGATRDLRQDQLETNPESRARLDDDLGFARAQMPAGSRERDTIVQTPETGRTNVRLSRPEGLAMAAPTRVERALPPAETRTSQARKVGRMIGKLLIPDQNIPNELNEPIRAAGNSQAARALESNVLTNELNKALDLAAKASDKPLQEVKNSLLARIDQIDALPTKQQRDTAVAAIERDMPGVGKALQEIRDKKLSLSREIVALRLRDKRPLTAKEEALYKKILDNAERYNTRAYLSTYNDEIGKTYGRKLLEAARSNLSGRENQIVGDGIDYLVDNELLIPDESELTRMPIARLRRFYENWALGDAANFKGQEGRRQMIDRLLEIQVPNRIELESKALGMIEDMLGISDAENNSRRRQVTLGQRQNRTILEGRTDIPEPLRKILGEITDPVMRETLTLYRMNGLVAKTKLLTELYEGGQDKFWAEGRGGKFINQINGENYGPLNGKWVDQDTYDALTGVVVFNDNLDANLAEAIKQPGLFVPLIAKKYADTQRAVIGASKFASVVAAPMNFAFNFVGSPLMLMMNGVNPFTHGLGGINMASRGARMDISVDNASDRTIDLAMEAAEAGAMDTASVGEFRTDFYRRIQDELHKMVRNGEDPNIIKAVARSGFDNTVSTLRNTYALMDVWVKAATYLDRKDFWTKMNEAEGLGMTDEQIRRKAGYDASTTNISYDRAIPLAKIMEQNTPFSVFLTYFSEALIRVPIMNGVQVFRDIKLAREATTEEGRSIATKAALKRGIGTLAATAGVIGGTLAALGGESEEEKKQRELDPPWYRNSVLLPYGRDAEGRVRYLPVNRFDPLILNEKVVNVVRAEDKLDALWEEFTDLFVLSKPVAIAAQTVNDAVVQSLGIDEKFDWKRNKTLLEQRFPDLFNQLTQIKNDGDVPENLIAFIDAFIPTGAKGALDESRDALGYKPLVRDPQRSLGFRIYEYDKNTKALKKDFTEFLKTNPSGATLSRRMLDTINEEQEHFDALYRASQGFLASPKDHRNLDGARLSKSDLVQVFKDEQKSNISREVMTGRFRSKIVSREAIKKWYDEQRKQKGVDKADLRKRYELLMNAYRELDNGNAN